LFNGGKLLTQMFVAGMGTNVIAGNFIAFSVASLINLPGNAGLASTIITGKRLGKGRLVRRNSSLACVLAVDHYSDADCLGQRAVRRLILSIPMKRM
jgi:Na+-driven multidrug efflux pump